MNELILNNKNDSATFHQILIWRAKFEPDKLAFKFLNSDGQSIQNRTYKELDQEAQCIAVEISKTFNEGERAILLFNPGLEFIAAFFGCLYAGVVAVPIHPPRSNQFEAFPFNIANDCSARLILTTAALYSKLARTQDPKNTFGKETKWLLVDQLKSANSLIKPDVKMHSGSPALLQYTSGSTSKPKGIIITHNQLFENAKLIQTTFKANKNSVCVSWLPFQHDMGLMGCILQPIYMGNPAVLMSPMSFLQRPIRWLRAINEFHGTITVAPSFAYELCVQKIKPHEIKSLDLTRLDIAGVGSEPVRFETLEKFSNTFASCGFKKESFLPCYGLAESTLFVTGGKNPTILKNKPSHERQFQPDGLYRNDSSNTKNQKHYNYLVCCGKPMDFQKIITVNPFTLEKNSFGETGEIWVSSPNLASGYWNAPLKTNSTFSAYTKNMKEGPFLRTGDIGIITKDGLYITGRLRDVMIIRGKNHYPQDIEHTLEQHINKQSPCSSTCFTVQGDQLIVLLESVSKEKAELDYLADNIQTEISKRHGLEVNTILFLKKRAIPKTTSGKIKRYASKQLYLANKLQPIHKWKSCKLVNSEERLFTSEIHHHQWKDRPKAETKRIFSQWLTEQLAIHKGIEPSQIDLDKPFLDFGLDSVTLMDISGKLEMFAGFAVPPTSFYDYPTIRSLANYLVEEQINDSLNNNFPQFRNIQSKTLRETDLKEIANLSDEEIDNRLSELAATHSRIE